MPVAQAYIQLLGKFSVAGRPVQILSSRCPAYTTRHGCAAVAWHLGPKSCALLNAESFVTLSCLGCRLPHALPDAYRCLMWPATVENSKSLDGLAEAAFHSAVRTWSVASSCAVVFVHACMCCCCADVVACRHCLVLCGALPREGVCIPRRRLSGVPVHT